MIFIGLLGDSYYGVAEGIVCLNRFYDNIFQVADYTRNGIFFAPVFFILGGFIADNRHSQIALAKGVLGFGVSFAMMSAEALALDYSIVHYTLVCFVSALFSSGLTLLWMKCRSQKARCTSDDERAYLEISI